MTELTSCLESLGLQNVVTIAQSGNVIVISDLDMPTLKHRVEEALTNAYNYQAHVQVLAMDSLRSILSAYPFKNHDTEHHDYVVFFENGLETGCIQEIVVDTSLEQLQQGPGVIYWRVVKGFTLKSPFAKVLTKAAYKHAVTTRNLRTLQKIIGSAPD